MHLKRWENVSFVIGAIERHTVLWFVPCQAGHRPTSLHPHHAHMRLTQIDIYNFIYKNLTPFAQYNHACYNIEILIKLLIHFYSTYFLKKNFVTFFHVFLNFNTNVFTSMDKVVTGSRGGGLCKVGPFGVGRAHCINRGPK